VQVLPCPLFFEKALDAQNGLIYDFFQRAKCVIFLYFFSDKILYSNACSALKRIFEARKHREMEVTKNGRTLFERCSVG
jgi:hypothetical protein